jgi:tetratricopeptide (TPR) repeat protein
MRSWKQTNLVLWVLAAALAAAGLVPPAGGAAQEDELSRRLQQAVQKLDQGDTLGAMLDLEGILTRDDEYWPAYFYLGRAQAQVGDDLGAKASFMRAATLDPGNAELHYLVATAAWSLADFDAAWNQAIAARQAGYPQAPIDELLKGLDQYSDPPMDLEQRLAAPRFVVVPGADGAEADLMQRLRSAIFGSRGLGLVLDPALADFHVEIVGTLETWTCRVTASGAEEVLVERAAGDRASIGAIPGMAMDSLIRDLEALISR